MVAEGSGEVVDRPSGDADGTRGELVWRVLACVAAGSLAGAVVGGMGGRLVMLVLRLTSPGSLRGVLSDDGFEIGVVTADTIGLIGLLAAVGAFNGALYAVAREALPARLRLIAWTVFGGATGGAAVVHTDGVDFVVVQPAGLAIACFVLLPATASAAVATLGERWARCGAPRSGRRAAGIAAAAALGSAGLAGGAAVVLAGLAVRRLGLASPLARSGRVAIPVTLAAAIVAGSIDLARDAIAIL